MAAIMLHRMSYVETEKGARGPRLAIFGTDVREDFGSWRGKWGAIVVEGTVDLGIG